MVLIRGSGDGGCGIRLIDAQMLSKRADCSLRILAESTAHPTRSWIPRAPRQILRAPASSWIPYAPGSHMLPDPVCSRILYAPGSRMLPDPICSRIPYAPGSRMLPDPIRPQA